MQGHSNNIFTNYNNFIYPEVVSRAHTSPSHQYQKAAGVYTTRYGNGPTKHTIDNSPIIIDSWIFFQPLTKSRAAQGFFFPVISEQDDKSTTPQPWRIRCISRIGNQRRRSSTLEVGNVITIITFALLTLRKIAIQRLSLLRTQADFNEQQQDHKM